MDAVLAPGRKHRPNRDAGCRVVRFRRRADPRDPVVLPAASRDERAGRVLVCRARLLDSHVRVQRTAPAHDGEATMTDIEVTRAGLVATVRMTRPESLNSLDLATRTALLTALDSVAYDDTVGVVVLAGAGPAFCVGQD